MHWNHRVIRRVDPNGDATFGIHEVFYKGENFPDSWTENPVEILGDTIEDVKETLSRMLKCLEHPILTEAKNLFGRSKLVQWKPE